IIYNNTIAVGCAFVYCEDQKQLAFACVYNASRHADPEERDTYHCAKNHLAHRSCAHYVSVSDMEKRV
ncbi:hypothetical protein Y032_0650g1129, partial [Ancylostoma ceylanicum]